MEYGKRTETKHSPESPQISEPVTLKYRSTYFAAQSAKY